MKYVECPGEIVNGTCAKCGVPIKFGSGHFRFVPEESDKTSCDVQDASRYAYTNIGSRKYRAKHDEPPAYFDDGETWHPVKQPFDYVIGVDLASGPDRVGYGAKLADGTYIPLTKEQYEWYQAAKVKPRIHDISQEFSTDFDQFKKDWAPKK